MRSLATALGGHNVLELVYTVRELGSEPLQKSSDTDLTNIKETKLQDSDEFLSTS